MGGIDVELQALTPSMRRLSSILLVLFTLSLVGCDHITKQLAVESLQSGPQVVLAGVLELRYAENRDMAFGLLGSFLNEESRLWLLTGAKSVGVLGGFFLLLTRRKVSSFFERIALSLVISGALGNLIDRVLRGFVVDFVKLPHWPIFNVADMAIVLGVALLLVELFRKGVPERPSIQASKHPSIQASKHPSIQASKQSGDTA